MPIAAWLYVRNGVTDIIPFEDEQVMDEQIPIQFLRALVRMEQEDTRHQGTNLTVTSGLGCPRATFIQRALPAIVDPQKMVNVTMGTALHHWLAAITVAHPGYKDWKVEGRDNGQCAVEGVLFGHRMSGKMDMHQDVMTIDVQDWKTSMSGSTKFKKADEMAGQEHSAQLNMLRLLHGQQHGPRPIGKMCIRHVSTSFVTQECAVMTEEQIGRVRPGSNDAGPAQFTVRENFDNIAGAFKRWDAGEDVTQIAKSLPLAGETMYRSSRYKTSSCDNCAVAFTCKGLATGGVI